MNTNARRRKEILLFAIMLSSATSLVQEPKFRATYQGVFRFLDPLDKELNKFVPTDAERQKELTKVQMLVNAIVPNNWAMAPDEWRLWFTIQLAFRMVASGWKMPQDQLSLEFVQAMYQMSQGLNLSNPPPQFWLNKVAQAPEILRAKGVYK